MCASYNVFFCWLNVELDDLIKLIIKRVVFRFVPTIENLMYNNTNTICYCYKFQRGKVVALKSHSKYQRMSQFIWLKNPTDDWNCMSPQTAELKFYLMIS